MKIHQLMSSALIGAVASARSMTPMATLAAARLAGRATPGQLVLLDRPLVQFGALAMGVGELFGLASYTTSRDITPPAALGAGDPHGESNFGKCQHPTS